MNFLLLWAAGLLFYTNNYTYDPPIKVNPIDKVVYQLEKETGCKMIITSGYRTKAHNKKVGGAKNSYHLTDRARDLVPKDKNCIGIKQLGEIACKYTSTIVCSRHIHIGNREKRRCSKGK